MDQLLYDIKNGFTSAMDDDLNISAAMASLFKNIKKINVLALEKQIAVSDASKILDAFHKIDQVLGFLECKPPAHDIEIEELIETRNQARKDRNWTLADKLREQLRSMGVEVQDKKVD